MSSLWDFEYEVPVYLPVERFLMDWVATWGDAMPPGLLGLRNLTVETVPAGYLVRITDHEGREFVETRDPETDVWI